MYLIYHVVWSKFMAHIFKLNLVFIRSNIIWRHLVPIVGLFVVFFFLKFSFSFTFQIQRRFTRCSTTFPHYKTMLHNIFWNRSKSVNFNVSNILRTMFLLSIPDAAYISRDFLLASQHDFTSSCEEIRGNILLIKSA